MDRSQLLKVTVRVAASLMGSVLQALLLLTVARDVGPAGFAPFGQFTSIAYVFSSIVGLGFGVQALRMGGVSDARGIAATMFILRTVLAFALVTCLSLSLMVLGIGTGILLLAASSLIVNELVAELLQAVLSGQGRQHMGSIVIASQRLLGVGTSFAVHGAGASWWLSILVGQGLVFVTLLVIVVGITQRPRSLRRLGSQPVAYWLASILPNLSQLDVSVASAVGGATVGGYVAAGSRVNSPLSAVSGALLAVFLPRFAKEARDGRGSDSFPAVLRFTLGYAVLLGAASPLVAAVLIWYLGDAYAPAFSYFLCLVIAGALSSVSQVFQGRAYGEGSPRAVIIAMSLAVPAGLLVLGLCIAAFGIGGAGAGPIATQVVLLLVFAVLRRAG